MFQHFKTPTTYRGCRAYNVIESNHFQKVKLLWLSSNSLKTSVLTQLSTQTKTNKN